MCVAFIDPEDRLCSVEIDRERKTMKWMEMKLRTH